MANEAMSEIAILPSAIASAITRLLSIMRPTGAAAPRVRAGGQHLRVVLPEVVARHERHRHLQDLLAA